MNTILSVYFSGNSHRIQSTSDFAGFFHHYTDTSQSNHKVMGFDGCGAAYGISGTLWGTGLDEQCKVVIKEIKTEIQKGNVVTLNVFGHSRGGIAAFMLAKQLAKISPEKLEINLAVHDPVPGNFITTSTIDALQISLANKTVNLKDCRPLKRVLALYPHIPLPDIYCHAPLIAIYPEHTQVEQDVMAGCHSGAQFLANELKPAIFVGFARVCNFLTKSGTFFSKFPELWFYTDDSFRCADFSMLSAETLNQCMIAAYEFLNQEPISETHRQRAVHSARGEVIQAKKGNVPYYNHHHQTLNQVGPNSQQVRLTIELEHGLLARTKRFSLNHPIFWEGIKWLSFGILMTVILATTGVIPAAFFGSILLTSCLVAPAISGLSALLWHIGLGDIISRGINQFYYPYYTTPDFSELADLKQGPAASESSLDTPRQTSRQDGYSQQSKDEIGCSPHTQPHKTGQFRYPHF